MSEPIDPRPPLMDFIVRIRARIARQSEAAECNPLPTNCPFKKRLPKGRDYIRDAIEDGVIRCCRMNPPRWFYRDDPPLCRVDAEEVYRFIYSHAFGAHAVILIAKRRDEITVQRRYHSDTFNEAERFEALLAEADWQRLQDTLVAADFWSMPRAIQSSGLDGYDVIIEGRSGNEYRATRLNNPNVERFWMLGRVAFDLGSLEDVRL